MTNRLEPGPSHQTVGREDDESDGTSGSFGISGMDGFALTSQPRGVPAMRLDNGTLAGDHAQELTAFNEPSDQE